MHDHQCLCHVMYLRDWLITWPSSSTRQQSRMTCGRSWLTRPTGTGPCHVTSPSRLSWTPGHCRWASLWSLSTGIMTTTLPLSHSPDSWLERRYKKDWLLLKLNIILIIQIFQTKDTEELTWWVPITFTDPQSGFNKTYNEEWLSPQKLSKQMRKMPNPDSPVIFNVQQTGYYRFFFLVH